MMPLDLPMGMPGFAAMLGGPRMAGMPGMDDMDGMDMPGMAEVSFGGGGAVQESHSIETALGDDGKEHTVEVATRCVNGKCETTRHERDGTSHPPASSGENLKEHLPAVLHTALGGIEDGGQEHLPAVLRGELGGMHLHFMPDLSDVLAHVLSNGQLDGPSGFQSLRLRPGPSLAGRLAAPLEHSARGDGSEVIQGELPVGLDAATLTVQQRGDVVLLRYLLNHTANEKGNIGVEQQFHLGFQPERKEKAEYNPATGHFQMIFARPKNADFDPNVEIVFVGAAKASSSWFGTGSSATTGTGFVRNVKPDVIFEVGDEL